MDTRTKIISNDAARGVAGAFIVSGYFDPVISVHAQRLQGLKEASPAGYPTREGTTALSQLVEAYRLTWDPALLELMDRFAVAIFDRPPPKEEPPGWDWDPPGRRAESACP